MNNGGILIENKEWRQLACIKYKNETGRINIISKEELRQSGISSPDVADALMLTCIGGINNTQTYKTNEIRLKQYNQPTYY